MIETPPGTVIDLFTSIGRQKYCRAMIRAMPLVTGGALTDSDGREHWTSQRSDGRMTLGRCR